MARNLFGVIASLILSDNMGDVHEVDERGICDKCNENSLCVDEAGRNFISVSIVEDRIILGTDHLEDM